MRTVIAIEVIVINYCELIKFIFLVRANTIINHYYLDLTTNGSIKKFENKASSEYFSSCIMKALKEDLTCDVATIKVNLRLFTLKPLHAVLNGRCVQLHRSDRGKEIIKAAGITDTIANENP